MKTDLVLAENTSIEAVVAQALVPLRVKTAEDLVRRFRDNYSDETIKAYNRDLAAFTGWLESITSQTLTLDQAAAILLAGGDMMQANAVADGFRSAMMAQKLAPNTINRRLTALRSLVALAKRYGLVGWDLTVDSVRSENYRDTRGPGLDGLKKQVRQAKKRTDPKGIRDYAILRLNVDLALRRSSIAWMNVGDVDLETGRVSYQVKGRGPIERKVKEAPDALAAALADWLEVRRELGLPEDESAPLFVNFDHAGKATDDGRLTGHSVNRIIKAIAKEAGIKGHSSHRNRHAAITAALDATDGNLAAVADFADHADPRTTQRYNDNRNKQGSRIAKLVSLAVED